MKSSPFKPQFAKVGRTYVAGITETRINAYSQQLRNKSMKDLQRAINSALSEEVPNRKLLLDVYLTVMLDGHLQAVMEKRINAILNRKVEFIPEGQDETPDDIREFITGTPWFRDLIKSMMMSIPYGYSLTELVPKGGMVESVVDIDRRNVIPEWDALVFDMHVRTEGINYLEDPKYSKYLIFTGDKKSFGKLMHAAPYVIFKQGALADWAQFIELYGMPIKEGRYDPYDDNMRRKLDEAIKNMGAAPHIVLPKGAEFDLHDVTTSGTTTIQKDLVELCNAEISKVFLGNTLTTEQGQKGARSLGEVHQDVEESINTADAVLIEYKLNWELADKLREIGYKIPKGEFKLPQTKEIPLEKRIEIDKAIHDMMPLPREYWIEMYGVHPEENQSLRVSKNTIALDNEGKVEDKKEGDGGAPEKKQKRAEMKIGLKRLYANACEDCGDGIRMEVDPKAFDAIWERLAKQIHEGETPFIDDELLLETSRNLTNAIVSGISDDKFLNESKIADRLLKNVQIFSGFKTYQQLQVATELLEDEKGLLKPFSAFLQDIKLLNEEYNTNYLKAEYNHAVASAQMADKWNGLESEDMIKYVTAKDERVRETHRVLEGVTRKKSDDFWATYYPPNGWGCRCTAIVTVNGTETPAEDIIPPDDMPEMFKHNPGVKGVVFPDTHPYFKVPESVANNIRSKTNEILNG